MKSAQDYLDKAAKTEALADDPRQSAEARPELRSMACRSRHWAEQAQMTEDPARRSAKFAEQTF
jgi:hypothetical protein